MVDPRKHGPQLVRIDQAHDLPQAVGARFLLPDQPFHPVGLAQMSLHPIQTALPENKEEKNTAPDRLQRDTGPPARVLQLIDFPTEIKDFLHISAEALHHGRFPLALCFSWKNRWKQDAETFSINRQTSW
jgi:hypothetical protein